MRESQYAGHELIYERSKISSKLFTYMLVYDSIIPLYDINFPFMRKHFYNKSRGVQKLLKETEVVAKNDSNNCNGVHGLSLQLTGIDIDGKKAT